MSSSWLDEVADPGSFTSWDTPLDDSSFNAGYQATLARARQRTGVDESIITGSATVGGHRVALVVSNFAFLGGSIGAHAAARIIAAFDHAQRELLPVLAAPASGGTRMQEGTAAFLQMLAISRRLLQYRSEGLPYLVHLRNPTTGGVLASWASLGDDTVAQPGARIGLLGPRVVEALGHAIPDEVQRAENLSCHGVVDAVADAAGFRQRVIALLELLGRRGSVSHSTGQVALPAAETEASWPAVLASRAPGRPRLPQFLKLLEEFVPRRGGSGTLVTGFAWVGCRTVMLVGQDSSQLTPTTVHDLACARETFALAQRLSLPVVAIADTAGAELSMQAESDGLARCVAETIAAAEQLSVPSATLLLGEGAGAGALALCGTDLIVTTEHAWLGPLPPEGAAAISYRDAGHAEHSSNEQRISAAAMFADGLTAGTMIDGKPLLSNAGAADTASAELGRALLTIVTRL